jgi:ubiquinone biosynthesis protein COQ9
MTADTFAHTRDLLLDAILGHVPFDGWSEAAFTAAIADTETDAALARAICPRGAVDLALAQHARGDALMLDRLAQTDMGALRFRDRIATAVRFRLEATHDREVVRRAVTLFALPHYGADGARAIWGTVDAIWTALGDTSRDGNWYSKRATLSAVYSSTLLYWLGDDSAGHQATWDFLDRRIGDVMRIETLKAKLRDNPALKPLLAGPQWLFGRIRAPGDWRADLPGSVTRD